MKYICSIYSNKSSLMVT